MDARRRIGLLGLGLLFLGCLPVRAEGAYGTPVTLPDRKTAKLETVRNGDLVLVATWSKGALTWRPRTVYFSQGLGPVPKGERGAQVIFLTTERGELVISRSQLFLMPSGKLKAASKLTPKDQLVDEAGHPVAIRRVTIAQFQGGLHHISVEVDKAAPYEGHLLIWNGIVCGDYHLQLHGSDLEKLGLLEKAATAPEIGNPYLD